MAVQKDCTSMVSTDPGSSCTSIITTNSVLTMQQYFSDKRDVQLKRRKQDESRTVEDNVSKVPVAVFDGTSCCDASTSRSRRKKKSKKTA